MSRLCADCGKRVPGEFPGSVCPACLWGGVNLGGGVDEGGVVEIGGHEVLEEMGRGGMGIVYRARELSTGREVALKMLLGHLADTPGMRERFRIEGRAVAALDHAAILPVYRLGDADGVPFFSMKLVEGGTLSERGGELAGKWREIAELAARLAGALGYAHRRGMLHRDVKPGNVLFDDGGVGYLCDFGLAKLVEEDSSLTMSAHLLGTPLYMAPEVAEAGVAAATVASDLWGLGAVLYELLAGVPPFRAEGMTGVLRKIVDEAVPDLPGGVPRDLAVVCLKCLEKDPARRYASAEEFAADLRRWMGGYPILARPTSRLTKFLAWGRRNPAAAGLGVVSCVGLLGFTVALWRENGETRRALGESLIANAESEVVGQRPGWRERALETLERAAVSNGGGSAALEAVAVKAMTGVELEEGSLIPYPGEKSVVSPDLEHIAWRGDGSVVVSGTRGGGRRVIEVEGLGRALLGPFSADGEWLMLRGDFGSRVLSLGSGEWSEVCEKKFGTVCFSDDGRWLVGGTASGAMVLVGLEGGNVVAGDLAEGTASYFPLSISPDGRQVAAATGGGKRGLAVFSLPGGELLRRYDVLDNQLVFSAEWSLDGNTLYAGLDTGQVYRLLAQGGGGELLVRAGGQVNGLVALGGSWLGIQPKWGFPGLVLNVATGEIDHETGSSRGFVGKRGGFRFASEENHRGGWVSYALKPGCAALVELPGYLGARVVDESPGRVGVDDSGEWGVVSGGLGISIFELDQPYRLERMNDWRCVSLDVDGRRGLIGFGGWSESYLFKRGVPDLEGRSGAVVRGRGKVVSISEVTGVTAVVSASGELSIIGASREPLGVPGVLADAKILSAAIHPDGGVIAAMHAGRKGIVVCGLPGGEELAYRQTTRKTPALGFAGGSLLIVGDQESYVCWDYSSGEVLWEMANSISERRPAVVAAAWRGGVVAVTADNRSLLIVDSRTGEEVLPPLAFPQNQILEAAALDAEGRYCVAMAGGSRMQVWDLGELRRELAGRFLGR